MNRTLITFSLLVTITVAMAAPRTAFEYHVGVDPKSKYLNVECLLRTIPDTLNVLESGRPLQQDEILLKMPVWAPGYYVIMDYPKHLTDFVAYDDQDHILPWTKVGKNGWRVSSQTARVTYRIFADGHDVASSRVEDHLAFIAPGGVFMYADGFIDDSVSVTLHLPAGWHQCTVPLREKSGEPFPIPPHKGGDKANAEGVRTYAAPTYHVLYDSPMLLGNHRVISFTHEGHDYEMAFETPEGIDSTTFVADFKALVSATTRLMKDVPYDKYCLIHLGEGQGGLEHQSSQLCYTQGDYRFPRREDYLRHLSFVSHEYFHLYNVKALRPREFDFSDYDAEVHTPMLWVSEGFTCYYEVRNLLNAGLLDADYLLAYFSSYIQTIEENEGHHHMSLRQSSYDIWLNFFNRDANSSDVRISYYDKGPILGLLFDIELRYHSDGMRGLDHLMRHLYDRFCKTWMRGFHEEEFWQAAAEVMQDDEALARLRRYVDTTDPIDYADILGHAGLALDDNHVLYRLPDITPEQRRIQCLVLENIRI